MLGLYLYITCVQKIICPEKLLFMYNAYIMNPTIFLDRDGVVMENRSNYVRNWGDVCIYPDAVQALVCYASSPYQIVFVTNQSVVGRGIISFDAAQAINQRLAGELQKSGCRIDGIFMCPHAPNDNCFCRKPRPGLLQQAAAMLPIDLANSIIIGDAWTDLQAGKAAGLQQMALVRTGRGRQQLKLPPPPELSTAPAYDSLADALKALVPWS